MRSVRPNIKKGFAAASTFIVASFSAAAANDQNIEAVLSNLPASASATYTALYDAAGRPRREILDMTKAEVWSIPAEKWDGVAAAAAAAGVQLGRLDDSWNHALRPMADSVPMTDAQKSMMHEAMESKAAVGMAMMALPTASLTEYALTKGMHAGDPAAPQPQLIIPISNGNSVTVRRTHVAPIAGGYAWHGVVEETGEPVTLLWWPSGKMSGSVTYHNHKFAVRDFGGGMHAIIEMKPEGFPVEHAPMGPEMMKKMRLDEDPLVKHGDASMLMAEPKKKVPSPAPNAAPDREHTRNQEDAAPTQLALAVPEPYHITQTRPVADEKFEPANIRLIVAYTKAAARHYSNIATDLIPLAIEEANESFRNSGISNVMLELAYTYMTDYVESGSHFDHVFRFADKGDGYMDEVHALRDQYKADVGVLIVDDPHGCGLSAEVYARPERAFAVVHHECAANMYSLAHEIGHLIGARHDEALDDSKQPFAFGHGFVFGKSWRTMMSYKDSCDGCPRIPVWSSPAVMVNGVPAGNADSNNARVIAQEATRVAKFR
jgi:hypothetical protein